MSVVLFLIKIALKSYFLAFRETVTILYITLTNATVAGFVLYLTRFVIRIFLWITNYVIDKTGKGNPVVKVVEKEVVKVPQSKVMVSDEHPTAEGIIGDSVEEVKLISKSFMAVVLTWIIKTATSQRRQLIASISEKTPAATK